MRLSNQIGQGNELLYRKTDGIWIEYKIRVPMMLIIGNKVVPRIHRPLYLYKGRFLLRGEML